MKQSLENLVRGQVIAVRGCRNYGVVLERVGKNVYLIDHPIGKGQPFQVARANICTYVRGRYVENQNASELAPHFCPNVHSR